MEKSVKIGGVKNRVSNGKYYKREMGIKM